ncbi:MAG: alpha-glucan family phosphorylase [candidate division Zixibacteria bacterium]|nr:alpha-glucan family phosphorylase [candidate division Zixibacteria bacterium]
MRLKQFLVLPKLPERIIALQELSQNLWYSWNWDMLKLFIRLDPEMWEQCYQNPVEMLAKLPQETLQQAASDDGFVASLNRVYQKYHDYLDLRRWWQHEHSDLNGSAIGYFSLEFGLDTGLPVYSGGLGILSGDTLKAASDLGLPTVAIGLLYRYGYFRQFLSSDGWQQERYEENDWYHMPVQLVRDKNDKPLRVTVMLGDTPVQLQIWKVSVGIVPLYLLDSNIPENSTKCREVTSVLYGGDKEMRIQQEIILGIGGVRALKALGVEPTIFHLNEGHSWFLTLERIRNLMQEHGLSYQEARQYVWSTTIFTTHTPVPAGNEKFDTVLIHRYLSGMISELEIPWKEFIAIGRMMPKDDSESFGMTVAALKTAAFANGVSKLHGQVSRNMWHNIWPELPIEEVPIRSITNGVHLGSWISHNMQELYESYFGSAYTEHPGSPKHWKRVNKIPDTELWRTHNRRRERLIFFSRKRLKQQLIRRGTSHPIIRQAEQLLDPRIMTIGFARRFSTYKRGALIFSDPDRLERIVNNEDFPVQIILAGKAHPLDSPGKEIIKKIISYISQDRFRNRIVFLEDYDINVARYMVQGVDVWLNTPRRPQEASGTSGMKAALNGALHLSILDGWWDEGYSDDNGFKIGNGEEYENVEVQDRMESEMLFNILEKEVIPLFYDTNDRGIPSHWIAKMKASIEMAGEKFSAHHMLVNYVNDFYVPAIKHSKELSASDYAVTRSVTAWLEHITSHWDNISIENIDIPELESTLYVGQKFPVTMKIHLGDISPDDVRVEIISGHLNSQENILNHTPSIATLVSNNGKDKPEAKGIYTFAGEVTCTESGRFGIRARVIPENKHFPHTLKPKLISWW